MRLSRDLLVVVLITAARSSLTTGRRSRGHRRVARKVRAHAEGRSNATRAKESLGVRGAAGLQAFSRRTNCEQDDYPICNLFNKRRDKYETLTASAIICDSGVEGSELKFSGKLFDPIDKGQNSMIYSIEADEDYMLKLPRSKNTAQTFGPELENAPPTRSTTGSLAAHLPNTYSCKVTITEPKKAAGVYPALLKDRVVGSDLSDVLMALAHPSTPPAFAGEVWDQAKYSKLSMFSASQDDKTAARTYRSQVEATKPENCKLGNYLKPYTREKYDSVKEIEGSRSFFARARDKFMTVIPKFTRNERGRMHAQIGGHGNFERRSIIAAKLRFGLQCFIANVANLYMSSDNKAEVWFSDIKPDNIMYGSMRGEKDQLVLIDYIVGDVGITFENWPWESLFGCRGRYWDDFVFPTDTRSGKITPEAVLREWGQACETSPETFYSYLDELQAREDGHNSGA